LLGLSWNHSELGGALHLTQQLGLHKLLIVTCRSLDVLRGQESHARELIDNLLLLISHFMAQFLLVKKHH